MPKLLRNRVGTSAQEILNNTVKLYFNAKNYFAVLFNYKSWDTAQLSYTE